MSIITFKNEVSLSNIAETIADKLANKPGLTIRHVETFIQELDALIADWELTAHLAEYFQNEMTKRRERLE